ncbi:hypothetical protein F0562_032455 [Nyssa sinensis]|uniref:Uncharacterized protein n=1 Tax=Nyssa sinensis TaxID=561372 RepID=A0A5J5ARN9_9ASTE|nr:hypothetical protein F0562_032455 [Nyssa sinensis]
MGLVGNDDGDDPWLLVNGSDADLNSDWCRRCLAHFANLLLQPIEESAWDQYLLREHLSSSTSSLCSTSSHNDPLGFSGIAEQVPVSTNSPKLPSPSLSQLIPVSCTSVPSLHVPPFRIPSSPAECHARSHPLKKDPIPALYHLSSHCISTPTAQHPSIEDGGFN